MNLPITTNNVLRIKSFALSIFLKSPLKRSPQSARHACKTTWAGKIVTLLASSDELIRSAGQNIHGLSLRGSLMVPYDTVRTSMAVTKSELQGDTSESIKTSPSLTASSSHFRTTLPQSSSRPLPAEQPNHATQSLFDSKSLQVNTKAGYQLLELPKYKVTGGFNYPDVSPCRFSK